MLTQVCNPNSVKINAVKSEGEGCPHLYGKLKVNLEYIRFKILPQIYLGEGAFPGLTDLRICEKGPRIVPENMLPIQIFSELGMVNSLNVGSVDLIYNPVLHNDILVTDRPHIHNNVLLRLYCLMI